MISVLVVDDSAFMRKTISTIIESDAAMKVIATAMNGKFALNKLQEFKIDLILLDLEMPEMNGLQFLEEMKKRKNDIPIIIVSSKAKQNAPSTLKALELGAVDFVTKPGGSVSFNMKEVASELLLKAKAYALKYKREYDLNNNGSFHKLEQKMKKMGFLENEVTDPLGSDSITSPFSTDSPPLEDSLKNVFIKKFDSIKEITTVPVNHKGPISLVCIGVSTGGPNALRMILPLFPKNFPVPILIVQHMPDGFTKEFAKSLDGICQLKVKEAEDMEMIIAGNIYIAPGLHHMTIEKNALGSFIKLQNTDPVNGHRPSVGMLFSSALKIYRERTLAVIMTGMGRDGSFEIGKLLEAGGITLGQNKETSVVYGMPRIAAEQGFLNYIVPLDQITKQIIELVDYYK